MNVNGGLSFEKRGGFLVVRPERRLGMSAAEGFSSVMHSLVERGEQYLAVDMCDVEFISSTCLGLLVQVHHELRRRQGRIVIGNINPEVERIFSFSRLKSVLELTDDLESLLQFSEQMINQLQASNPSKSADDDDLDSIL